MTRWLTSWKTQATLAVLGALYLVVGLIGVPIDWSAVITGVLVSVGSGCLAVSLYLSQRPADRGE